MIDVGAPAWIFYTSAIFTIICMFVVMISARYSRVAPVVPGTKPAAAE